MNDAERLSQDPPFRLSGSKQLWEHGAARTSRAHSFETELLTQDENLAGLAAINREPSGQCESISGARTMRVLRSARQDR